MTNIYDQVQDALQSQFLAQVTNILTLPTGFENMRGDALNQPLPPADGSPYLRFLNAWGETTQVAAGGEGHRYRTEGIAVASLFTPLRDGDATLLSHARRIAAPFRDQSFGGIQIQSGISIIRVGVQGAYWRTNVHIPWVAFEDGVVPEVAAISGGDPDLEGAVMVVRDRFKTEIADPNSLPTQYDNDAFDPPVDGETSWAHWSVRIAAEDVEIGGGFRHTPGLATANLFVPAGSGTHDALLLAGEIVTAFRSVADRGVTFQSPSLSRTGRAGSWWQINVRCPFYFETGGGQS